MIALDVMRHAERVLCQRSEKRRETKTKKTNKRKEKKKDKREKNTGGVLPLARASGQVWSSCVRICEPSEHRRRELRAALSLAVAGLDPTPFIEANWTRLRRTSKESPAPPP